MAPLLIGQARNRIGQAASTEARRECEPRFGRVHALPGEWSLRGHPAAIDSLSPRSVSSF